MEQIRPIARLMDDELLKALFPTEEEEKAFMAEVEAYEQKSKSSTCPHGKGFHCKVCYPKQAL